MVNYLPQENVTSEIDERSGSKFEDLYPKGYATQERIDEQPFWLEI